MLTGDAQANMPESVSSGLNAIIAALVADSTILSSSYILDELLVTNIRSFFRFLVTILLVTTVEGFVVAVGTGTCYLFGK